ncbi:MAG: aldolase [Terriglobia bacterium]|nr:MAG: aldolase [Terriglobia bacterium]
MKRRRVLLCVLAAALPLAAQRPAAKENARAQRGLNSKLVDELVLANHILAANGVLDAYGHVSVRDDRNPNHFLLARHMAAGLVTPDDIIEYDFDSNAVGVDASTGYTERFIHGGIYKARPDVMSVVHFHAPEVIPFGVTSVPLQPVFHMAGFLGEGVPIFDIRKAAGETDMLIRNVALGQALAASLASKPAVLLRGHGAVVVAPALHVVAGRAYYMTANARLQAQAIQLGAGKVTYLDPEEARKSAAQDGFERAWALWKQTVMAK